MANTARQEKENASVVLTPEERAAFERGLRSEATGKDYSLEECLEFARKRRQEWTKKSPENAV